MKECNEIYFHTLLDFYVMDRTCLVIVLFFVALVCWFIKSRYIDILAVWAVFTLLEKMVYAIEME